MKVNTDLTRDDMETIKENEKEILFLLQELDKVRQFKLGDYLICIMVNKHTNQRVPMTNSYNVTKKFKVVHVDQCGIPYYKEVSSKGTTRGPAMPMMGEYGHEQHQYGWDSFEFEHDPHFVESVILEAEAGYDPVEVQKSKKKLRDEITKHNADNKIKSSGIAEIVAGFAAMKPGETYWFSGKNGMTINSVKPVVIPTPMRHTYGHGKYKNVVEINVTLSTGKQATYLPHDFMFKNLYKAQPRSYRELSETI